MGILIEVSECYICIVDYLFEYIIVGYIYMEINFFCFNIFNKFFFVYFKDVLVEYFCCLWFVMCDKFRLDLLCLFFGIKILFYIYVFEYNEFIFVFEEEGD